MRSNIDIAALAIHLSYWQCPPDGANSQFPTPKSPTALEAQSTKSELGQRRNHRIWIGIGISDWEFGIGSWNSRRGVRL